MIVSHSILLIAPSAFLPCSTIPLQVTLPPFLDIDFEIIVDHDSHDIIKELNNYVWSDKKSNTPIDNFNHIIDAIRYVVFYQKHKTKTVRFNRR